MKLASTIILVLLSRAAFYAQTCSSYTNNPQNFPHLNSDTQEHIDSTGTEIGDHYFSAPLSGACTYSDGPTVPGPCAVSCLAVTNSSNGTLTTIVETGSTVGLFTVHATAKADSGGAAASNGGTAV